MHSPQTALQRKIIYNSVRIFLGPNCTWKSPVQCWPMANRQLLWEKKPMQYCIDHAGTALHRNIVQSMLSKHVWDNIAPDDYLCNVSPERTGTFSQEKNLYNVVLICMCQHCTGNYLCNVDPYPMKNFAGENNLQCYPNLCGPTLRNGIISKILAHSWQKTFLSKITYTMLYLPSWENIYTEAVAQTCSVKKSVLRNFVKFTGKYLCQSLFFK